MIYSDMNQLISNSNWHKEIRRDKGVIVLAVMAFFLCRIQWFIWKVSELSLRESHHRAY